MYDKFHYCILFTGNRHSLYHFFKKVLEANRLWPLKPLQNMIQAPMVIDNASMKQRGHAYT